MVCESAARRTRVDSLLYCQLANLAIQVVVEWRALSQKFTDCSRGGLGRLAAWLKPGGPVRRGPV